jgi:hypothetical protein
VGTGENVAVVLIFFLNKQYNNADRGVAILSYFSIQKAKKGHLSRPINYWFVLSP